MEYVKIIANSHSKALEKLHEQYGNDVFVQSDKVEPDPTFMGKILGRKRYIIGISIPEKKKSIPKPNTQEMSYLGKRSRNGNGSIQSKINDLQNLMDRTGSRVLKESNSQEINEFLNKMDKMNLLSRDARQTPRVGIERRLESAIDVTPRKTENTDFNIAVLSSEIRGIKDAITHQKPIQSDSLAERNFEELMESLQDTGMSRKYSAMLVNEVRNQLPPNEWKHLPRIYTAVKNALIGRIRVNSVLGSRRVIVLVGPTGAGKTTTQAKLAAHLIAREKRKVALVTTDTYRIAATEQMKIYGNIMATAVHVCKSPTELDNVLQEEKAELILLDTAGVSSGDRNRFEEQTSFFIKNRAQYDIHLVLPATAKRTDADKTLNRYDSISFDKIILSKLDETSSYGGFVELADTWHRPFSFFTDGQDVPKDYQEADRKYFAEKVLENWSQKVHKDVYDSFSN